MRYCKKILFAFCLTFIVSCSPTPPKEIQRVASPDGKVDAVIATEEDAFSATQTSVHIVPAGKNISDYTTTLDFPTLLAYKAENLSVSWAEPKKLVISFSSARIFSFTNYWDFDETDNAKYRVQVYLKDKTAP
jgi:hypothetical protein